MNEEEIREYHEGELIFSENETPDGVYIVKEGLVQVFHTVGEEEIELERVGARGMFGEMGIVDHRPRSASARAACPTTVVFISREAFHKHFYSLPPWVFMLVKSFVRRLRETNRRLYDLLDEVHGEEGQNRAASQDTEIVVSQGSESSKEDDDDGRDILRELGHGN